MVGKCELSARAGEMAVDPRSRETRQRLERCWTLEFEFDLLPDVLKEVCLVCQMSMIYMHKHLQVHA